MVLVEEVALEKLLCSWILEMNLVLFNCLGVLPLLVIDVIDIEVFVVLIGLEGGDELVVV